MVYLITVFCRYLRVRLRGDRLQFVSVYVWRHNHFLNICHNAVLFRARICRCLPCVGTHVWPCLLLSSLPCSRVPNQLICRARAIS